MSTRNTRTSRQRRSLPIAAASSETNLIWTWSENNPKTGPVLTAFVGPTEEAAHRSCFGCALYMPRRCYAWRLPWGAGARTGAVDLWQRAARDPRAYSLEGALARMPKSAASVARLCGLGDPARCDRRIFWFAVATLWRWNFVIEGFTHHWREPANRDLAGVLMASCDTPEEADIALWLGWRPTVLLPAEASKGTRTFATPKGARGLVCNYQANGIQCASCGWCEPTHAMWASGEFEVIGFVEH